MDPLIDGGEVVRKLRCDMKDLKKLERQKLLRPVHLSKGKVRYRKSEVEKVLRDRRSS